jgi:hypothetical protein
LAKPKYLALIFVAFVEEIIWHPSTKFGEEILKNKKVVGFLRKSSKK